jgi:hypothetical protein
MPFTLTWGDIAVRLVCGGRPKKEGGPGMKAAPLGGGSNHLAGFAYAPGPVGSGGDGRIHEARRVGELSRAAGKLSRWFGQIRMPENSLDEPEDFVDGGGRENHLAPRIRLLFP